MYEYPRMPEGNTAKDIVHLWEDLYKLIEQLNVKEAENDEGQNRTQQ